MQYCNFCIVKMNKKLKIIKGRVGIAEKGQETRRDHWDVV